MNQKMDPELKIKWVAALRSGKYKQAREQLRGVESGVGVCHCCLGVLCDIVDPNGWIGTDEFQFKLQHSCIKLPDNLKGEINLNSSYEKSLVIMNDAGDSFDMIADWIEANL